jgi:multidrug efflux system membrane fusion protein
VKKGDLLFRIDPKPFVTALKQAEGNLARNRALLQNSRIQAKRQEELAAQGIVSKQTAEQMTSSADALEAAVQADLAAVEQAKLLVEYCDVYAPIDGRTGALLVFPGTVVKANDVPVLVVINQIHPVYVEFSVPEQHLPAIQREFARGRMLTEATLQEDPRPVQGTLTFLDNLVDRATGTIRLRATFSNEDSRLWPGQYVNVSLTVSQQNDAIVVPSTVVQSGQDGTYVFVVKSDERVEMRPVSVSRTFEKTSVIGSGLQVGETVVLDGQISLVPNSKVSIKDRQ